jgi:hypothetical protein
MGLNCIGDGMQKERKMEDTDAISNLAFTALRFNVPTSNLVSPASQAIYPIVVVITFSGI